MNRHGILTLSLAHGRSRATRRNERLSHILPAHTDHTDHSGWRRVHTVHTQLSTNHNQRCSREGQRVASSPFAMPNAAADSILATAFSPCGEYLVCGTAFGWIHTWKIATAQGSLAPTLHSSFRAHRAAVYALIFVNKAQGHLLLSGADEEIHGWEWERLPRAPAGETKPFLVLQNPRQPQRRGALGQLTDTAAFSFDARKGVLYSAAGDGNAYAWDLEKRTTANTFAGEGEPLYCVATRPAQEQVWRPHARGQGKGARSACRATQPTAGPGLTPCRTTTQ